MKAFLLAAGLGTRLRPVTDTVPKCMVEVGGKPLLDLWLDALGAAGVVEVLVNLHHLPDVVTDHLERRGPFPRVLAVYEPELLGSAGTMWANRAWIGDDDLVLACNADNLTDFDIGVLVQAHVRARPAATVAVVESDRPQECGIVEIDDQGLMSAFVEKPAHPSSNLANAGMYVFERAVIDEIGGTGRDIGFDLLPTLVGRALAVRVHGYFRDIGTLRALEAARREWPVGAGA